MRYRISLAIAAVAALALPACGSSSSSGSQAGGHKQLIVGWTPLSNPTDQSRVAFNNGIKEGIEAVGGKELYCSPSPAGGATGDPNLQANCVSDFITEGANAIIVYPIDIAALAPVLKKATAKGIKVFDFTSAAPSSTGIDMSLTVFSGDYQAGQLAGQALVKALTKKYGSPKGTVLEIQGLLTTEAAVDRGGGFHSVVNKYPNIHVVSKAANWDPGMAGPIVTDYLTAHPDTDAIYMQSGAAYLTAVQATLTRMHRWLPIGNPKHVILVAGDDSNATMYAYKCGFMDEDADLGFVNIAHAFSTVVMKYMTTGKLPPIGSTIKTGDPLFPTARIVNQKGLAGPQMLYPAVALTKANIADHGLFGNALQPPPNGTTACKSGS